MPLFHPANFTCCWCLVTTLHIDNKTKRNVKNLFLNHTSMLVCFFYYSFLNFVSIYSYAWWQGNQWDCQTIFNELESQQRCKKETEETAALPWRGSIKSHIGFIKCIFKYTFSSTHSGATKCWRGIYDKPWSKSITLWRSCSQWIPVISTT